MYGGLVLSSHLSVLSIIYISVYQAIQKTEVKNDSDDIHDNDDES